MCIRDSTWADLNIDRENRVLRLVTIAEIHLVDERLAFGGKVFTCGGLPVGNFDSNMTSFSDHTLTYTYQRTIALNKQEKAFGRGKLNFTRSSRAPRSYFGSFYDPETETEIEVEGEKIIRRSDLKKLKKRMTRAALVSAIADEFLGDHPNYSQLELDSEGVGEADGNESKRMNSTAYQR